MEEKTANKKQSISKATLRGEIEKLFCEGKSLIQVRNELKDKFTSMTSEDFSLKTKKIMTELVKTSYADTPGLSRSTVALNGSVYLKCDDGKRIFYISSSKTDILFEDEFLALKDESEVIATGLMAARLNPFDPRLSLKSMDTFFKVDSFYRRYIYFEDERQYDLITSYTVMTYCFELFNAVPYLKAAGTKSSGKTTTMKVMSDLVNKGIMTSNITQSSLFRIIDKDRPTLFLDEAENLAQRNGGNNDLLLVLNSGYEKNGSVTRTVKVMKGDTSEFIPESYSIYCPKVIAAINSLAPATEDRCIVVELKKAPEKSLLQQYVPDDMDLKMEIAALKDLLNLTALKISKELTEYIKDPGKLSLASELKNRHLDRWLPILSIAKILSTSSKDYFSRLKELCMKDIEAKQVLDDTLPENMCRKIISEYVKGNLDNIIAKTVTHYELNADDLFKVIKENDIYNTYSNKGQLTRELKKLKVVSKRHRVNGLLTPLYCIPVGLLS